MFSCLKRVRILTSRSVRWQYVWCSNGTTWENVLIGLYTSATHVDVFSLACYLFDGHLLLGDGVDCGDDHPVGALAKEFQRVVARSNLGDK